MEQIKVNEKAVERLKRKIILQENQNLKTRTMTDQQISSDHPTALSIPLFVLP